MTRPENSVVHLLRDLIAFDTTSARSNLALIEYVRDYLLSFGVESRLVHNEDRQKAGLIASIGPAVAGGVVLSGHTDVVPVAEQAWSSDPFRMVARDGRLYGRGTADMKGFIAAVLAMIPEFLRHVRARPIHLAWSYDEELGCAGGPPLIAALTDTVLPPALAIIGEPSEMRPGDLHRGIATYRTTVRGRGGHSSAPDQGVNAIVVAAECIAKLVAIGNAAGRGDTHGDERSVPPVTVNVGKIAGGTAVNIIAPACIFEWECRTAPGSDPSEIEQAFAAFALQRLLPRWQHGSPPIGVETERCLAVPPLKPDLSSRLRTLVLDLAEQKDFVALPFASEAGQFQQAGIPSVVCGPGSVAQAHQPDEYLEEGQLCRCVAMLQRLAEWSDRDD